MQDGVKKSSALRFADFELDVDSAELRCAGATVKLQSQHLQLLVLLAGRAGQVVTRQEIRQALWDDQTFVDFDRSINFAINQIRAALRDDPQEPRYIQTLPRKGYRFIAAPAEPGRLADDAAPASQSPTDHHGLTRRWWFAAGGGGAVLAAIAVWARTGMTGERGTKAIESLAVLPLDNLSRDPEQEYFADGMTDELITALAKISALRVISRTSVMQYKRTNKPVAQIARELNVDALLEGTVMRDAGRIRITAQLIRAAPEQHLWAERYEGALRDALTMQDSVAQAVAREIQVRITAREQTMLATRQTVDPQAYEAYLRALYLNPTEENLRRSAEYLLEATNRDPGFARAWAWLGVIYELMGAYSVLPAADAYARARDAAQKALSLDQNQTTAIAVVATTKSYDWDWAGAEREYKRAIAINPNNGLVCHNYAAFLGGMGRSAEAIAEAVRERDVSPAEYWASVNVTVRYYFARQYRKAETESAKLMDWEPGLSWGYICCGSVYLQTGRRAEAVALLQKAAEVSHRGVFELMYFGHALGISGAKAQGKQVLNDMLALSKQRHVRPEFIAVVYEGLGERDSAIEWFEKGYAERSMHQWVLPDPRLDAIRKDARFHQIMRRMGLGQWP